MIFRGEETESVSPGLTNADLRGVGGELERTRKRHEQDAPVGLLSLEDIQFDGLRCNLLPQRFCRLELLLESSVRLFEQLCVCMLLLVRLDTTLQLGVVLFQRAESRDLTCLMDKVSARRHVWYEERLQPDSRESSSRMIEESAIECERSFSCSSAASSAMTRCFSRVSSCR